MNIQVKVDGKYYTIEKQDGRYIWPVELPQTVAVGTTVAANVLEWGTGALNIDASRVGSDGGCSDGGPSGDSKSVTAYGNGLNGSRSNPVQGLGRWPANTIFTHAADCGDVCVVGCPVPVLDGQSGQLKSGMMNAGQATKGYEGPSMGKFKPGTTQNDTYGDSGGASRFFKQTTWTVQDFPPFIYIPKPSKRERNAGCDAKKYRLRNDLTEKQLQEVKLALKEGANNAE